MEYELEHKIRLNATPENNSLYPWCLQEINDNGEVIGLDLIPFKWNLFFTASELILRQNFSYSTGSIFDDEDELEEEAKKEKTEIENSEVITAKLHSGTCSYDGKNFENDPVLSMLGTDREIKNIYMNILATDEDSERCSVWGSLSYTTEIDFREDYNPDTLEIRLWLSSERFETLKEVIRNKSIDVVNLVVSRMSGVYSEWSPSISTNKVKVLTTSEEHKVEISDDCNITPPELGEIKEFDLRVITRSKLNPKQDFRPIGIYNLFDDYEELEVPNSIESHSSEESHYTDKYGPYLAQIMKYQAELLRLRFPLWLIVLLLAILVYRLGM